MCALPQVKRRVAESQGGDKVKERSARLGMLTKSKFEKRTKLEKVLELWCVYGWVGVNVCVYVCVCVHSIMWCG